MGLQADAGVVPYDCCCNLDHSMVQSNSACVGFDRSCLVLLYHCLSRTATGTGALATVIVSLALWLEQSTLPSIPLAIAQQVAE
jgi:hypothetical protein